MTPAERDEQILSLRKQVEMQAKKFLARLPRCVQRDDIESAGWVGAIRAVDTFNATKNVTLASWGEFKIRCAILDYLRSVDPVSRDERQRMKREEVEAPKTFSLTPTHDDAQPIQIADRRSARPFETFEARADLRKICARATTISARNLRIVHRYAGGEKMKAIGEREGVNESRISQICRHTLRLLRQAA